MDGDDNEYVDVGADGTITITDDHGSEVRMSGGQVTFSPSPLAGLDVLHGAQLISTETLNRKKCEEQGVEPIEFRDLEVGEFEDGILTRGNLYREYFISKMLHQFNATLAMRALPSSFREETLQKLEDQRVEREAQERFQAEMDAEDVKPDAIVEGN